MAERTSIPAERIERARSKVLVAGGDREWPCTGAPSNAVRCGSRRRVISCCSPERDLREVVRSISAIIAAHERR
jgi:hypothetical protein